MHSRQGEKRKTCFSGENCRKPGETKAKEGVMLSYVFDSIGRQRRSLAFL